MYKKSGKVLQRMKESGWSVGKSGVPMPNKKHRSKRKKGKPGKPLLAKRRNPNHQMPCPECGVSIPRVVKLVWSHFLKVHGRRLTEPEAYRIASYRGSPADKIPVEVQKKDWREVSGGLPSLGKRR